MSAVSEMLLAKSCDMRAWSDDTSTLAPLLPLLPMPTRALVSILQRLQQKLLLAAVELGVVGDRVTSGCAARPTAGPSPILPAGLTSSPILMQPRRNVPVARTTLLPGYIVDVNSLISRT